MTKASLLLAALPVLLTAACAGTSNRGLESVHQPVVGRTDVALDLDAPGGRLAPAELQRLDGWLQTVRVGYGDRVAVDETGGAASAASGQVAGVIARYGLLLADRSPVTAAPITPGTVRVVVSRMRASVPGCPDWSRNLTNDFEGNTHSNYGCAINTNLAAMVANPADLVRGADGVALADPQSVFKAVDSYRKATPTGTGQALKVEQVGSK
jgi:pilus assembly protein CpaD